MATIDDALRHVIAGLDAAERRDGQTEMAEAVDAAIRSGRHLIVEAGTGTGKTIAYLTAAALNARPTVVVTATKALQDQLATKDLPFVEARLADLGVDLEWAILKGRSNYLCLQRLREHQARKSDQMALDVADEAPIVKAEIKKLTAWAADSATGDQAELDWSPSTAAWQAVSVGSDECPGASRCPIGEACFAEQARRKAQASSVIVVNTHLYGLHVASDGVLLPEHEVVIFDEAHVIEDIMSDTVGVQITPGRFVTLAQTVRGFLDDPTTIGALTDLAGIVRDSIADMRGDRLSVPLPDPVIEALETATNRVAQAQETVTAIDAGQNEDAQQRKLRAQRMLDRTTESLAKALAVDAASVPFVSGPPESPRLEIAPLDVGPTLRAGIWDSHTAILTSATIPSSLRERVGLPDNRTDERRVDSPFDYQSQGLLYCAMHLPEPRSPGFRDAAANEIVRLISSAGGRTLALFTSWAGMEHAVEVARDQLDVPILTQRDLPKPALIAKFAADDETCLFATTGLFQGVDVPGDTLSLVIIDKLPFPRPDDPLLSARRDALGRAAFSQIDIPRAATLLAQAVGRLIRTSTDRGAVAVLDPRLGTARYRWDFINALPPMARTKQFDEVDRFLRSIDDPDLDDPDRVDPDRDDADD